MSVRERPWAWIPFIIMTLSLIHIYSGKGEKEYGKAETMVILTTERLRYENVYSEEIWTAEVDGGGTAFETVLTGQIHDFLKELKVMSLMAREKEITLSSREKELAKTAAGQYMDALGSVQAEEFGLTEEDVYKRQHPHCP